MCGRWLASPIKFTGDYGDWREMNPVVASRYDGWRDEPRREEFASVSEFLDEAAERSRYFHSGYDGEAGAFFVADAAHGGSPDEIASSVAALRGAESFVDADRPSFVYVFPAATGGDPDALLRIERGKSRFLFTGDSSPETLYFVNEAEEFIEEMLEDDDELL
jgi:hypothetical protein